MNIQHAKELQLGSDYVMNLIESIMTIMAESSDYVWRGMYNTTTSYSKGDVVLVPNRFGIPKLVYASENTSGAFDSDKWNAYEIEVSGTREDELETNVGNLSSLLNTVIFALTGSNSYKGTFSSRVNYSKGDIATTVLGGSVIMVRAKKDISAGEFTLTDWDVLRLMTEDEIASLSGSKIYSSAISLHEITIPITGWVDDSVYPGYGKRYDFLSGYATGSVIPCVIYDLESLPTVKDMNMNPVVKVEDGIVRFYATKEPAREITATMAVIKTDSSNNSVSTHEITLNHESWVEDNTYEDYSYRCDIDNTYTEDAYVPCAIYHLEYVDIVEGISICPILKTTSDKISFFSKIHPDVDIDVTLAIIRTSTETDATITTHEATLLKDNWVDDSSYKGYTKRYDLANTYASGDFVPCVMYHFESFSVIKNIRMCPVIKTSDSVISFYAQEAPTDAISITILMIRGAEISSSSSSDRPATANRIGGVIVGDGLSVDSNGVLTLNIDNLVSSELIASDDEVDAVIAESLGLTNG